MKILQIAVFYFCLNSRGEAALASLGMREVAKAAFGGNAYHKPKFALYSSSSTFSVAPKKRIDKQQYSHNIPKATA